MNGNANGSKGVKTKACNTDVDKERGFKDAPDGLANPTVQPHHSPDGARLS